MEICKTVLEFETFKMNASFKIIKKGSDTLFEFFRFKNFFLRRLGCKVVVEEFDDSEDFKIGSSWSLIKTLAVGEPVYSNI